jgi:hypothetical protein
MMSRRAVWLAASLGLVLADAAWAQGNGPGFHAAIFFDGGCSAAFNQTVSAPTPPATAGATTAPCVSGTAAAGGEAAATTLRAMSHSAHECCGTFSGSTGRARIQIENVVIVGPPAASIPVSINLRMRGALASHPNLGQAGAHLYIALGGGLQSTSALDMSSSGYINKTGLFAPLSLGFPSAVIDQHLVTPLGNAVPNQPLRLDLELMTYSAMAGSGATHSDFFTGPSGVALPLGLPVFNLPPDYAVSIAELNIVNNFVVLPATMSDDIFIVGTNASEVSLPGLTVATGNINIDNNTAATSIDISQLESVGGSVNIDNNTAATIIDISELDSVGGSVNIDNNTAATSIDISELDSVGGSVNIDNNTAATSVDISELDTVGGTVAVGDNDSMVSLDLGSLATAGGNVTVSDNDAMTSVDLATLTSASGSVTVNDNDSMTSVDLAMLTTAGGDVQVSNNGPCTAVSIGALATVTGNLVLESCGLGAFIVGPAAVGGNAVIASSGYDSVSGASATGTSTISNATPDARLTVHLQAGTFAAPTRFTLTRLDPGTLVPVPGLAAGGAAATIDPIAAYQITFGVPVLNRDATLTFDIFLAGLDAGTATALLAAVANGTVTLVTRSDAQDSRYQAFPVCAAGNEPTADGCIVVQLLDAAEQPTAGAPAIVRFAAVTGHFSTWGVAFVTPSSTPAFAFRGLLSPYPAPPHEATPAFQQGRVVPLKFAWVDGGGALTDSANAEPGVRIYPVSCASLAPASDPITPDDAGGTGGLRYDADAMTWIFNWSTRSAAAGCYSIEVSPGNQTFATPASTFPVSLQRR